MRRYTGSQIAKIHRTTSSDTNYYPLTQTTPSKLSPEITSPHSKHTTKGENPTHHFPLFAGGTVSAVRALDTTVFSIMPYRCGSIRRIPPNHVFIFWVEWRLPPLLNTALITASCTYISKEEEEKQLRIKSSALVPPVGRPDTHTPLS